MSSSRHMEASHPPRVWLLAAAAAVMVAGALASAPESRAEDVVEGTLVTETAPGSVSGLAVDYTAYLPAGYDASDERYASLYLLHGRGDTMAAWPRMKGALDELIADGKIPPVVVIMPDAPWSERGNYYVDSAYAGSAELPAGAPVETAITKDLVTHVDDTYRTVATRNARGVGGYSMGGYGAIRYALAHQELFAAGLVLSPAVYVPTPPDLSSAREFGAFGDGDDPFVDSIYEAQNYPALLPTLDPATPTHLFIAVGDDEWMNPDPQDAHHDLDFESARLYNSVRRSDAITAEFRVLDGGHDWDVWAPAFREGVVDVMGHVRTTEPDLLDGVAFGTPGDDRAGGLVASDGGGEVIGVNVASPFDGVDHEGGMDAVVLARQPDGTTTWATVLGTDAADRAYGVEAGDDGGYYVGGYTSGDLDGQHPAVSTNDAFAVRLTDAGAVDWINQFGDDSTADRVYATAPAAGGGMFVAGYTSGMITDQPNQGDKDAFLARLSPAGEIVWIDQLGGPGEDKGLAVVEAVDGSVYVGGVTSAAMPGAVSSGDIDGWYARYSPDGTRDWLVQPGTAGPDQVSAIGATEGGDVLVAGYTGGVLGDQSSGANDGFVRKVTSAGAETWTTQFGSLGDDRVVDLTVGGDGTTTLAGHTDGRMVVSSGGTDVFTVRVTASGEVTDRRQVGTPDRDGADVWDEGNLYVALRDDGTTVLEGLTYGSTPAFDNLGEGDVFLSNLSPGSDVEPIGLDVAVNPADPDGRDGWYTSPVTATATSASDATIEFNVDGAGWKGDDDGVLVVDIDGSHTLDVRAVRDDETPEVQSFTMDIDATAPDLAVDGIADGDEFVFGGGDEVVWSADDVTSGLRIVRVRLDGDVIDRDLPDGGPFLPGSAEVGEHELFVRAHDVAGNFVTMRYDFTVVEAPDTTKPVVTVTGVGDGEDYGDSRVLHLVASATDADSDLERLRVKLDGNRIYQGDSPYELALPLWDLDLGDHRLKVIAWDTAGNRKAVAVDFTVGTSITDVLINLDRFEAGGFVTVGEARQVGRHVERAQRALDVGRTNQARKRLQRARDAARDIGNLDVRRLMERDLTELIRDLDGNGAAPDTTADAQANARALKRSDTKAPEFVEAPDFLDEHDTN